MSQYALTHKLLKHKSYTKVLTRRRHSRTSVAARRERRRAAFGLTRGRWYSTLQQKHHDHTTQQKTQQRYDTYTIIQRTLTAAN